MMRRLGPCWLPGRCWLLGLALLAPRAAEGATCGITAVSAVAFGTYDPRAVTPLDGLGSVTYQCSLFGALEVLYIELGKGNSSTFFPRRMLSSGHTLDYNLYLDEARQNVWGDGTVTTVRYGPTLLNLFPNTLTIYGRIPQGQNAFVGSYTDTVVITANF